MAQQYGTTICFRSPLRGAVAGLVSLSLGRVRKVPVERSGNVQTPVSRHLQLTSLLYLVHIPPILLPSVSLCGRVSSAPPPPAAHAPQVKSVKAAAGREVTQRYLACHQHGAVPRPGPSFCQWRPRCRRRGVSGHRRLAPRSRSLSCVQRRLLQAAGPVVRKTSQLYIRAPRVGLDSILIRTHGLAAYPHQLELTRFASFARVSRRSPSPPRQEADLLDPTQTRRLRVPTSEWVLESQDNKSEAFTARGELVRKREGNW